MRLIGQLLHLGTQRAAASQIMIEISNSNNKVQYTKCLNLEAEDHGPTCLTQILYNYFEIFPFFPSKKKLKIKKHTQPNSMLNFVFAGRKHKAPVKFYAASAVPPIYIASCIGIANKETTGTICHSFIAELFLSQ